ncbi:hypothetical protein DFJ74DRAFT_660916 [Hyaloraphidium curvatum]|nr:hypothetical protein DFJ74DRAFT_660916 [Hyaloraphidium curvatum]
MPEHLLDKTLWFQLFFNSGRAYLHCAREGDALCKSKRFRLTPKQTSMLRTMGGFPRVADSVAIRALEPNLRLLNGRRDFDIVSVGPLRTTGNFRIMVLEGEESSISISREEHDVYMARHIGVGSSAATSVMIIDPSLAAPILGINDCDGDEEPETIAIDVVETTDDEYAAAERCARDAIIKTLDDPQGMSGHVIVAKIVDPDGRYHYMCRQSNVGCLPESIAASSACTGPMSSARGVRPF